MTWYLTQLDIRIYTNYTLWILKSTYGLVALDSSQSTKRKNVLRNADQSQI